MVAGRVFEPWILSIDYCYTIIDVFEEPGIILNFILLFGFLRAFCVLRSARGLLHLLLITRRIVCTFKLSHIG
jgi:hypothetical protein